MRVNVSSVSNSYRANVSPDGLSTSSTRAIMICCARITEVTAAMPSATSPQPCFVHCRWASSMGSR